MDTPCPGHMPAHQENESPLLNEKMHFYIYQDMLPWLFKDNRWTAAEGQWAFLKLMGDASMYLVQVISHEDKLGFRTMHSGYQWVPIGSDDWGFTPIDSYAIKWVYVINNADLNKDNLHQLSNRLECGLSKSP